MVTLPSMVATLDAAACLRVLLAAVGHFTMARKPPGAPSLLIVDELSAIQGGRRAAIDLLERGRGAGTGVILAGQSPAALGDEDEHARLLAAAASAVIAFRSPQPAELAALAGSERVAEAAWQAAAATSPVVARSLCAPVPVSTRTRSAAPHRHRPHHRRRPERARIIRRSGFAIDGSTT